jgi:hypothetical protein
MGQSPSQEAQKGANGEPERKSSGTDFELSLVDGSAAFVLHQSTEKKTRGPLKRTAHVTTKKDAARPKKVNLQDEDTSEGDDDDESDWSDWGTKANAGANRTSTPDRKLGPSTYETTSGAEDDNSDGENQMSRSGNTPPVRGASQELRYLRSRVWSPVRAKNGNAEGEGVSRRLRSHALKKSSQDDSIIVSDGNSDSPEQSDSEASTGDVESPAQMARETTSEQQLRLGGALKRDPSESQQGTQYDKDVVHVRTTASDQDTSSSSSIFDNVQDSAMMDGNLVRIPSLKRKWRRAGGRVSGPEGEPAHKRRKGSIFSPPTSVPPEDEDVPRTPSSGLKAIRGRFKINRTVIMSKSAFDQVGQDQGSMAARVKPLSFGSSLKHPLFNPSPLKNPMRSRAANLSGKTGESSAASLSVAQRRTAKKSSYSVEEAAPTVKDSSKDEGSNIHKRYKNVFSSPQGKSRAEQGVQYTSPPDSRTRTRRLTSTKKSGERKSAKLPKTSANDSLLKGGIERKIVDSSESGLNASLSEAQTERSADDSPASNDLTCDTCNRKFIHEKELRIHQQNSKAHSKSYTCSKCEREFESMNFLLRHQSQANHPRETFHARRTGPFSEAEKQKLQQFLTSYCDAHGINETVFRQMMTDTSRRGRDETWSWPWVTRSAFLDEYFDVLPDRAHRSMHRYKERYFQNLDHNKEWTKEDDKLLLDLVAELGPKWIEIGLRLSRTQDSVTQRYKKKLKMADAAQSGPWSSRENDALEKAVGEVKDELGLAGTTDGDEGVPWFEVSKRMGGIRTAHQCSTRWCRVQRRKGTDRRESAKAGGRVKSKEFISSETDEDPGYVEDEIHAERFDSVAIPKNPTKKLSPAKHKSPRSERRYLNIDQALKQAKEPSAAAPQVRASPELGSSDYEEQNSASSTMDSYKGIFADPPARDDTPGEPIVATAEEWERILEAEGQPLPPLTAPDMEDSIPGSPHIQDVEEAGVGENSHVISTARIGRIANSKASRYPSSMKTPAKVMGLSQAFNATQALTSALRPATPTMFEIPASNSSRPSPDIEIKLHPDLSQDPGPSQRQSFRRNSQKRGDEYGMRHNTVMQEISDSSGESNNDTAMDADEVDEVSSTTSRESEVEYSEYDGDQTSNRLAFTTDASSDGETAQVDGDADESGDDVSEKADALDEYESGEEVSNAEDDPDMTGDSDENDELEDSNDSMVKDTHNDFMANIKESAKYMSQRMSAASRKFTEESDDDSE